VAMEKTVSIDQAEVKERCISWKKRKTLKKE
jgi:hypothetical protein